jgi:hypothetical protein
MEETKKKEVFYSEYCLRCEHYNTSDQEEPCDSCLEQPFNYDSHKPINFKEGKN